MRHLLMTALMLAAMARAAVAGPFEDAFRGDAAAQLKVGDMFADGDGVPEDYGEAVKWYRLAADQGHAPASFTLGLMYDTGLGVPKDHDEAAKWYRKAADHGYGIAKSALKLHPSSPVLDALTHVRRHYIDLLLELHFQGREARRDCESFWEVGQFYVDLLDARFCMRQEAPVAPPPQPYERPGDWPAVPGSGCRDCPPPRGPRSPSADVPKSAGKSDTLSAIEHAADQGHLTALWKLARMYAAGDGVPKDDERAFLYFSQIANTHPDEPPGTAQARLVANAFVALGHYYLKGIPNTTVAPDAVRARDMFAYAASYFGDADAQYQLGRLYLDGSPSDPRQAVRWFQLAATKGDCRAEAMLGDMLFQGQYVPRQAARGLMWLTLARDCAGSDDNWIKPLYDNAFHRANDDERTSPLGDWYDHRRDDYPHWIKPLYENAFNRANDDERAAALVYLEDWLKGRRD